MHTKRKLLIASGFLNKKNKTIYKANIKDVSYLDRLEDITIKKHPHFIIIPFSKEKIIDIEISSFVKIRPSYKKSRFRLLRKTTKEDYIDMLLKAKKHIENGDIYQINLAMRFDFELNSKEENLFWHFYNYQPVDFGFFFKDKDFYIISGSMELFIKKNKYKITSKPIKGTSKYKTKLIKSQKDRAENLMITDVMRNDFNKISKDVCCKRLFAISKHKSLYHMYSEVHGKTKKDPLKIISQILPVASISGAPKQMATYLIKNIEPFDRAYYCGVASLIKGKNMVSSVLIRTLIGYGKSFSYYAGSGITYDSVNEKEYEENLLKSKFFRAKA
ncbi:chorismate-binding protein [Hydrogenobaculum acidophilum]